MNRIAVALIVVAVAASPAMAAKKKATRHKAEPTVAELNDNGYRFVRDSMPIYWPTIIKLMVYSNQNQKPGKK